MKIATTSLCLALAFPAIALAQVEDEVVRRAFIEAYGMSPSVPPSAALLPSPETAAAIAAGRRAVAAPTDRALQAEFTERLVPVIDLPGSSNIHEILFVVFKESTSDMQEDKKSYLEKLARMNKMGEALSEYLGELADASRQLGEMERGTTGRSTRTVPIMVRTFDPVWVESLARASGDDRSILCDPCLTTREATLNAEQVQREQESVLGLQRRLEAYLQETEARHAELESRTDAVIRMLAQVLQTVDREREASRAP